MTETFYYFVFSILNNCIIIREMMKTMSSILFNLIVFFLKYCKMQVLDTLVVQRELWRKQVCVCVCVCRIEALATELVTEFVV